jgi:outer membrane protein OmpA-like peptidoglycan-associated protein
MEMGMQKITILAAASILALGACSDSSPLSSWTKEAGSFLDEGGFGNATANNTRVHSGTGNIVVDLNNRFSSEVDPMVNFEFDSARLDAASVATLKKQADWIKQFPEIRFRVYGHTDLVGTPAYNKSLGLRRARAVVNYLVSQGIDRGRLEAVASFGETQPLIVTQERERKNRRTVTEVTGFVQNSSGPLNGKYAEVVFREYITSAAPDSQTKDANVADAALAGQ